MADGTPIIIKKKKVQAAGHHGGAWKVAYADFVTAMMAFFMVMWIMGMDPSTKSMIQGYFNDPFGMLKSPPQSSTAFALPGSPKTKDVSGTGSAGESQSDREREAERLEEMAKQIKEKIEKEFEGKSEFKALLKHLEMTITDEGLLLEFSEAAGSVFFLSGDWHIRPEAELLLSKVAPILGRSGHFLEVQGHTDAEPYNDPTYTNWDLSADRALEMRRVLSRYGVPIDRYSEVVGLAATRLKTPDNPLHYSNRRVTVLLPFQTVDTVKSDLPMQAYKEKFQGVFRKPVDLEPDLRH